MILVGEKTKNFSSTLLGLVAEALKKKLTKDRLSEEEGLFDINRGSLTEMKRKLQRGR